jgi:hypothetical protein
MQVSLSPRLNAELPVLSNLGFNVSRETNGSPYKIMQMEKER